MGVKHLIALSFLLLFLGCESTNKQKPEPEGVALGADISLGKSNYLKSQQLELGKISQTRRAGKNLEVDIQEELIFKKQSAGVSPTAIAKINRLADVIKKYPEDRLRIIGYKGNGNGDLAIRRARAIRAIMVSRGVPADKIKVESLNPPPGFAKNRQVVIQIGLQ